VKNKWVNALGFISGALTTIAYIPQVVTIWSLRPQPATAVSLRMYILLTVGIASWFLYGILIRSKPVIIANGITLILSASILLYKVLYG
jgi:MtN3 and saliva related transmembrane protein